VKGATGLSNLLRGLQGKDLGKTLLTGEFARASKEIDVPVQEIRRGGEILALEFIKEGER